MFNITMFNIDYEKYPKGPGLTMEQAQKLSEDITSQYGDLAAASKDIEMRLGINRSFPGYLGKR